MTATRTSRPSADLAQPSVFERILVAVDGGKLSFDACRQAALLACPETAIEAATVTLFPPATAAALGARELAADLEETAGSALLAAGRILGPHAELRRLEGIPVEILLAEVKRTTPTLLAIGAPEHARVEEIVFGGVGGELLHQVRCSVLLARAAPDERSFPRTIVVGLDGSKQAERAYAVAHEIAARRHGTVQTVVALGGKRVALGEIAKRHRGVETSPASPVPALVAAAECADLLVVGSRGLHGPRALGSVSERVAHSAPCSVLVVR
jgi:nucleotide-binding universal stress UspA family protein